MLFHRIYTYKYIYVILLFFLFDFKKDDGETLLRAGNSTQINRKNNISLDLEKKCNLDDNNAFKECDNNINTLQPTSNQDSLQMIIAIENNNKKSTENGSSKFGNEIDVTDLNKRENASIPTKENSLQNSDNIEWTLNGIVAALGDRHA